MWTSGRRTSATHPDASRRLGVALALLACVGLTACTSAPAAAPATSAESDAVEPLPSNGELEAGTYLHNGFTIPFQVTVPDGWLVKDSWLLIKEPINNEAVFVNFLSPSYVPTDACSWFGVLADVGPTVEGFADALAAQESTTATAVTAVTVGDYSGVEFGVTVDGDVDIDECGSQHVCIHSEIDTTCTRYYQSTGRSEVYRVLDLAGERAVFSVGEDAGVPVALSDEAFTVFDSIEFVPAG